MKNSISFFFYLIGCAAFAQAGKIEPGVYSAPTSTTENIQLIITEDNKFHITLISGTFEQENDSVYFKTHNDDLPQFQLEFERSKVNPKTIKINLGNNTYLPFYDTYFGVQKNNSSEVIYKKLEEWLSIDLNDYDYKEKEYSFEIDKAAFIYIVQTDYNKQGIIEKYEVPENIYEVKIKKNNSAFGKLNLKGYYNSTTKEFIVSEGKTPLTFTKEGTTSTEYNYVKPIESLTKQNWTYPGKPNDDDFYPSADSTAVANPDYTYDKPQYVFKLQTEKNFSDAINVAHKESNKLLVVFYDTSKNAAKEFTQYIERYQTSIGYMMYDKYNPEYDNLNFYLATDTDKNALKKLGVDEANSIVFLNSDGTKLYHCKGSMTDYDYSDYNISYLAKEISAINALAKLDKLVSDKNATATQVEKVMLEVVKNNQSNYSNYVSPPTLPAASIPPPVNKVVEVPADENYNNATDSISAVADAYDYSLLKEKQNGYKFKTSYEVLSQKYKQVLDSHLNDKSVNQDIVDIILSELNLSSGFSYKLFSKYGEKLTSNDFQSINYLLKFYSEIPTIKTEDYYSIYSTDNLINTITSALNRPSNVSQSEKIKEYYTKLLQTTNQNPKVYRSLIYSFKDNNNKADLIPTFENYFNSFVKPNTNLIEELDKNFKLENASDWNLYKSDFSGLANDTAWFIVEKSQDKAEIQKAIVWSETSLKLDANNHYYLDTLAQLYYKNGEKEKAMLFEQKAIDIASESLDSYQTEEYKLVLEKMKNGTY